MNDERLDAIESQLRRLTDIEELRLLRLRYHDAINENRAPDIPELFTDDGEVDFGYLGRTRGRLKIERFFGNVGDLLDSVTQFIHNHVVEVEQGADTASGSSYLEAKSVAKGVAYRVVGRYRDTYRRTPDGWRFARMEFEPLFTLPFDESWATDGERLKMGR
ncbi:MAG: nuclear transport factor 2 family protein [Acidimicrobiia bacterium]|nr:nuclear transport factor 2 family protein [Acidimicrobiia bacterium]